MKLFVCIDERGGMTFNKRRQSRDPAVCDDIMREVGDGTLFISPFSEKLFCDWKNVRVVENPLSQAGGDCCFIENLAAADYLDKIDTLVIYNWNRHYPSDRKFDVFPEECGLRLTYTAEFKGVSHEKITKEVYKK